MAGRLAATLFAVASMILLLAAAPPPCQTVIQDLSPCIGYLNGNDNSPTAGCCSGLRAMTPYSERQADRTAVCECIKSYLPNLGIVNLSLVPQIPRTCGVALNLPNYSADVRCSHV